jgi:hypothetical protein
MTSGMTTTAAAGSYQSDERYCLIRAVALFRYVCWDINHMMMVDDVRVKTAPNSWLLRRAGPNEISIPDTRIGSRAR